MNKNILELSSLIKIILNDKIHPNIVLGKFFLKNRYNSNIRKSIVENLYFILRNFFTLESFYLANKEKLNLSDDLPIAITTLALDQESKNILQDFKVLELPNFAKKILERENFDFNGLEIFSETPTVDLRVNKLYFNAKEVFNILEKDGFEPQFTPFSDYCLRIKQELKPQLLGHHLYKTGKIDFQNEASQLACTFFKPLQNELIIDFCAGSGGKSLFFAELMRNKGQIYACEINKERLEKLSKRKEKISNSIIHSILLTPHNMLHLKNKADKVFVDAPCSGFGTLQNRPFGKFLYDEDDILQFQTLQNKILQEASLFVKDGGILAYATCSLFAIENTQVVENFLINNPSFNRVLLQSEHHEIIKDGYLSLHPKLKLEGFFMSLLQKK